MRLARAVLAIALLVIGFAWGFISHRERRFPYSFFVTADQAPAHEPTTPPSKPERPTAKGHLAGKRGRWLPAEPGAAAPEDDPLADAQQNLRTLGYLAGYDPAPKKSGVLVFDRQRANLGLNYYTSAHGPVTTLMDMEGNVVHRWSLPFEQVWPDRSAPPDTHWDEYWRRSHVYENGDLLAIYESLGLVKLDKDSKLLWAYPGRAHHEIFVAKDGTIYVLTRRLRPVHEAAHRGPVLEDFVTMLGADGQPIRNISVLDAFLQSDYADLVRKPQRAGDILHTNAVQVLDGRFESRASFLRAGNILISSRTQDALAIIDPDRERVVWALTGLWKYQHSPTLLDSGTMLLFDNLGRKGASRVMEFDPLTQQIAWSYTGDESRPLFSRCCGVSQRLPNGNTLITESERGRAIEVTAGNEIVWEFASPERAGERDELVATLFEVVRLRADFRFPDPRSATASSASATRP
jgi:hypothetical protein